MKMESQLNNTDCIIPLSLAELRERARQPLWMEKSNEGVESAYWVILSGVRMSDNYGEIFTFVSPQKLYDECKAWSYGNAWRIFEREI